MRQWLSSLLGFTAFTLLANFLTLVRLAQPLFINSLGLIRCCAKSDETDATLLQHGHSHGAPRPSLVEFDELKSTDSKSNANGLFDGLEKVKTIAWLLTMGDGLHNFLGEHFFR